MEKEWEIVFLENECKRKFEIKKYEKGVIKAGPNCEPTNGELPYLF
jgi:hypothetical protein